MTKRKTVVVRLERMPHRHAVIRVRRALRQLRQMPMSKPSENIGKNNHEEPQIQEKES